MRRELITALATGLGIAAVALVGVLWFNKGAHLVLEGGIQKVRVQSLDEACAVVADFRATNPADVPFVVRAVRLVLTDAEGQQLEGTVVADVDAKRLFDYYPALGQKFNESLKGRDRIASGQTVDRMIAARFEMPAQRALNRKSLRIIVEDVDGAVVELAEAAPSQ